MNCQDWFILFRFSERVLLVFFCKGVGYDEGEGGCGFHVDLLRC